MIMAKRSSLSNFSFPPFPPPQDWSPSLDSANDAQLHAGKEAFPEDPKSLDAMGVLLDKLAKENQDIRLMQAELQVMGRGGVFTQWVGIKRPLWQWGIWVCLMAAGVCSTTAPKRAVKSGVTHLMTTLGSSGSDCGPKLRIMLYPFP